MSRYRGSPSRSPFRSPPRAYSTERDAAIVDELRLNSAIRAESDYRRINDELSLLQIKVRHTNDLEDKVESLVRQNNQLARDNDELARQLNERKYEIERLRISTSEHHERESIRSGELYEINKSLELEIELLKKERMEGNRLYEGHIQKLERMLDDKVVELDSTSLKCSDLSKELEINIIRFEEEKNRLKNILNRTEHELERELEVTKERQISEKFSEIEILKRNYIQQIALLEDEINKLKNLNAIKSEEFESQLLENRNLRKRHEEEVRILGIENDDLRARMLKLEEINRSEVENIQVKYSDYHVQGTTNLKEQHGREIKTLLDEIDKLKWLVSEKNIEIQNLVQDKREIRRSLDEIQLELGSEIDSLKNKLYSQQEKNAEDSHAQLARINELIVKSLRDSESYHERVKDFRNKIGRLEAEVNDKQNIVEKNKKQSEIRIKELTQNVADLTYNLEKTRRQLSDSEQEKEKIVADLSEYKTKAQNEIKLLTTQLNETEVKLEESLDKLQRQSEDNSGNEEILRVEIESLRQNIEILEKKLSTEQTNYAKELREFTTNSNEKLKRLQSAQKKSLEDIQKTYEEQLQAVQLRVEKALREKEDAESELRKYIEMYGELEKYFKNPHEGALFEEKSKNSIYKVLEKVTKSAIHIF